MISSRISRWGVIRPIVDRVCPFEALDEAPLAGRPVRYHRPTMPSKHLVPATKTRPSKPRSTPRPRQRPTGTLQFKVTLDEIEPPVWRRVVVTDDLTFADLHLVLQAVMGWQNTHLHEFRIGDRRIGMPSADADYGEGLEDERKLRLDEVGLELGATFGYEYDFGDGWGHTVLLEQALPIDARFVYPACIAGARACPPEDCGGPGGYQDFLRKLSDPTDEEHDDALTWVLGVFAPEGFDVNRTNAALRTGR